MKRTQLRRKLFSAALFLVFSALLHDNVQAQEQHHFKPDPLRGFVNHYWQLIAYGKDLGSAELRDVENWIIGALALSESQWEFRRNLEVIRTTLSKTGRSVDGTILLVRIDEYFPEDAAGQIELPPPYLPGPPGDLQQRMKAFAELAVAGKDWSEIGPASDEILRELGRSGTQEEFQIRQRLLEIMAAQSANPKAPAFQILSVRIDEHFPENDKGQVVLPERFWELRELLRGYSALVVGENDSGSWELRSLADDIVHQIRGSETPGEYDDKLALLHEMIQNSGDPNALGFRRLLAQFKDASAQTFWKLHDLLEVYHDLVAHENDAGSGELRNLAEEIVTDIMSSKSLEDYNRKMELVRSVYWRTFESQAPGWVLLQNRLKERARQISDSLHWKKALAIGVAYGIGGATFGIWGVVAVTAAIVSWDRYERNPNFRAAVRRAWRWLVKAVSSPLDGAAEPVFLAAGPGEPSRVREPRTSMVEVIQRNLREEGE